VSYTPLDMLNEKNIPELPRPYYNETFYNEATYGKEMNKLIVRDFKLGYEAILKRRSSWFKNMRLRYSQIKFNCY